MPNTVPLTLPAMGESVSEGTVARWLKAVGDAVSEGEPLVEVTTDKVDVEVPSPASGKLSEISAPEGETISVGATLGVIEVGAAPSGDGPAPAPPVEAEGEKAAAAEDAPPAPAEAPAGGGERVDVVLPAMGESVTEGTVARWLKAPGDAVTEGESLVEVTTDKVDVEVPSPATGTLAEITAPEGETVEVGAVLAVVSAGAAAAAPKPAASAEAGGADQAVPEETPARGAPEPSRTPEHLSAAALANASPLARRAAALQGVDLRGLSGSGPGGIVRRDDVTAAPRGGAAPRPSAPSVQPGEEATPLRGPAAALVDYMEQSRDIPTATSFRTLPVGVLEARRKELNAALAAAGRGTKVSFTHLIGYAIARAAGEMPQMAAHFARDEAGKPVRVRSGVHLGLAVDSRRKDGTRFLVVPVIRDADARDFASFHAEYERLIDKARSNALAPDELRGATLSLTNPGGIGTMMSVPRLMPGQGCIIAAGALGYPPELRHLGEARLREMGIVKVMTMTSTYDHRIIQGAESGEFLARLEALLGGEDGFYEAVFSAIGAGSPAAAVTVAPVSSATSSPVESGAARTVAGSGGAVSRELLAAMQAATSLVKAHRTHGHLGAHLDPLGTPPIGDPAMEPETYGLTPDVMQQIPADLLRVYVPGRNLLEVLPNLRSTYCGTIAYEIEHISSHEQRVWLREHIEAGAYRMPLSEREKRTLLQRLTKVDAMERYLRRSFLGQKTFSGEGVDMLVPMLEKLLSMVADDGIGEVVLGMAHRGRLATIAHVVNRPYEQILVAFERGELRQAVGRTVADPTGDVKYHLGAVGTYVTENEKAITVRLLSNPSHLEAVDGVVEGWVRSEQTRRHGAAEVHVDPTAAMPVLIHGDAAFSGEGVVAEVLNLQSLSGYSTGGTVHVITNNQVGFTTDPQDARSTRYASDLAKGFDAPIVHVNADDAEACMAAIRFAYDFRRTYHRDVVVDLIGYRRFGHNESDEPAYTQPVMYHKIKEHPPVREIFVQQLVQQGLLTAAEADALSEEMYTRVADAHKRVKASIATLITEEPAGGQSVQVGDAAEVTPPTAVPEETLRTLFDQLLAVPDGFSVNAKLLKQLERRRQSLEDGGIDWGTAESLAYASLIMQGSAIRLSGQDTQRGTFSHRHLVLHDEHNGNTHVPMQHLVGAQASFEIVNSPLSEVGTLAFEFGYSAADPATLVIWEAQFGDFVNNAQMVVDQFISSSSAKWGMDTRLTLFLPHGYEGMGPEHSSGRLERFLQLSAHGNMRIVNPSTSAQFFHLLRSQALSPFAHPLVVMTPKSLLRVRDAGCSLADLTGGSFQPVIDDPLMSEHREDVKVVLLCSGKMYWEMLLHPAKLREQATDVAIIRVEQLAPLPSDRILDAIACYPNAEEIFWVQEEPENMGAWSHLARPLGVRLPMELRWDYIGRPRRASPSEGFSGASHLEQERIVRSALGKSHVMRTQVSSNGASGNGTEPKKARPEGAPETAKARGGRGKSS